MGKIKVNMSFKFTSLHGFESYLFITFSYLITRLFELFCLRNVKRKCILKLVRAQSLLLGFRGDHYNGHFLFILAS